MADVNDTRNILVRSPGALISSLAALVVDFIETAVGTSRATHDPTYDGSTVPPTITYEFTFTDPGAKTHSEKKVFWLGWLDLNYTAGADTATSNCWILQSAGSSTKVVVDMSAPGSVGDTLTNCKLMWYTVVPYAANYIAFFTTVARFYQQQVDQDFANATMNTHSYWTVVIGRAGGDLAVNVSAVTFLNIDPAGLVMNAMADVAANPAVAPVASQSAGLTGIQTALQEIAQMDTTVSINRGAAIYSVKGGVVVG